MISEDDFGLSALERVRLRWMAVLVLFAAFAIRAASISTVLPAIYHPDEPTNERVILRVAREPTGSPGFFHYPSLLFYTQAIVVRTYEAVTGHHVDPVTIVSSGDVHTPSPGYWMTGRSVTALLGSGVAAMAAWLAGALTASTPTGLVVGVWAALSPLLVEDSRYITPDTYAAFFAMAAVLSACRIAMGTSWRGYVFAGAMVGLAAGSKYNVVLVAFAVVVAHLSRDLRRGFLDPRLYLAGVTAITAFFVTTPFAVFDFHHFRDDLLFESRHYQQGHAGAEGGSLSFNVTTLLQSEGLRLWALPLLAFLRDRRTLRAAAAIAGFCVPYFVLISSLKVHFLRNLVPVIGPILVLSGLGVSAAVHRFAATRRKSGLLAVCAAVLLSVHPLASIIDTIRARRVDLRADAERWIAANVRAGSRVAVEPYGPWVDPTRYRVTQIGRYGELPSRELERKHVDYVVLTEASFGRYYADREHHAREVERYEALYRKHCEMAHFRPQPGSEIKVVDLRCSPAK